MRHCLLSNDFSPVFQYLYTLFELIISNIFPYLIIFEQNPMQPRRRLCPWVTLMCGGICVVLLMHSCSINVLQLPLLQLRRFFQFTVTWLDPLRFFSFLQGPYCKHYICFEWLTLHHICWEGLLCKFHRKDSFEIRGACCCDVSCWLRQYGIA